MTQFDYSAIPGKRSGKGVTYTPFDIADSPVVTVITPFFNTGAVFHETVACMFVQSLQSFEWIIIDDGSSDLESLGILNHYNDLDPRIRVVRHSENRGVSAARNTAFAEASTEYVFQLDSDDLIEPTTLEKCCWFLESYPGCAFVKGWTVGFGIREYTDYRKSFEQVWDFFQDNPVTLTAMVRRSVFQRVGGYDESRTSGLEDWEFWVKCADQGFWGATIWEHLDWYRTRDNHSDRWDEFQSENYDRFRKKLRSDYARLFQEGFPAIDRTGEEPYGILNREIPFPNRLQKAGTRRLLLLIPWFAVGGADMVNLDLLQYLSSLHDYQITVCATLNGEKEWYGRFKQYTDDIFILPDFLHKRDFPRFIDYLIASRDFDTLVVSNTLFGYQVLPYIRARHPRLAIVNFEHIEQEEWRGGNYPRFSINLQGCFDLNIVSTGYLKRWMVKNGADGDKIRVCYTNIDERGWRPDLEKRRTVRSEFNLDEDECVILFSGRLVEQKRPDIVGRILRELKCRQVSFNCIVVGDGPLKGKLEDYCADYGLNDSVTFTGLVTPERLYGLFAAADILLLPSINEGIALSCYEAMAMELVVLCSDVGGQAELVRMGCGITVPVASGEETVYADHLADLIRDPEKRLAMGSAAGNLVRTEFTIKQMADRFDGIVTEALDRAGSTPEAVMIADMATSYCIELLEQNRLREAAALVLPTSATGEVSDAASAVPVLDILESRTFRLTTALIGLMRRESVKSNIREVLRLILPERVKQKIWDVRRFSLSRRLNRISMESVAERPGDENRIAVLYIANYVSAGGADKMTIDWFKAMDRSRFATFLITTESSDNLWLDLVKPVCDGVYELPVMGYDTFSSQQTFILEFIRKQEIDVVHIMNSDTGFRSLPEIRKQIPSLKTVAQFHCYDYLDTGHRVGYAHDMPVRYDNLIDAYIVISKALKQDLKQDIPTEKHHSINLVYAGIDIDGLPEKKMQERGPKEVLKILFAGRLGRQKRPLALVDIARELQCRSVPFEMHIVGEGGCDTLEKELKEQIAGSGLEDVVRLHGLADQEAMPGWYASSDVLLMTSEWEGIPLVLLQAMASGLICVAPDVGGISEVLTNDNGILISEFDAIQLYADSLEAIATSPDLFAERARRARQTVKDAFDLNVMKRSLNDLYSGLVPRLDN
ncbi:MAG: glycosyltransferase [Desulfuromusa sp.]|nr:glycosyltransferase [Desulfuromusa sp.]